MNLNNEVEVEEEIDQENLPPVVNEALSDKLFTDEMPPIDPDKDFCDLYLGVKMDAGPSKCSVMIFNEDVTANVTFTAANLYIHGKKMEDGSNVENLLKSKNEDQDLILVYVPRLNQDGISVSEAALPLSSWDDDKFFYSGFVLYIGPKVLFVKFQNSS